MLGFTEIAELDAVMQKLVQDSGHYLCYTLCGGTSGDSRTESVAEIWARRNGCPIKYVVDNDFEKGRFTRSVSTYYGCFFVFVYMKRYV